MFQWYQQTETRFNKNNIWIKIKYRQHKRQIEKKEVCVCVCVCVSMRACSCVHACPFVWTKVERNVGAACVRV